MNDQLTKQSENGHLNNFWVQNDTSQNWYILSFAPGP